MLMAECLGCMPGRAVDCQGPRLVLLLASTMIPSDQESRLILTWVMAILNELPLPSSCQNDGRVYVEATRSAPA